MSGVAATPRVSEPELTPRHFCAVVFLEESGDSDPARTRVGGVPLLLRLFRVLQRLDITEVRLAGGPVPARAPGWAARLGLRLSAGSEAGQGHPLLLLSGNAAVQENALRELIDSWGGGGGLEYVAEGQQAPAVLIGRSGPRGFGSFGEARRALQPERFDGELACLRIDHRSDARRFHRMVEKDMVKETDPMFAQWNRRISIPLTRLLVHLPISPNAVTYITLLVAALGAWLMSLGGYWEMLAGAALTQLSSILDGNDGELARIKVMDSDFGTWLDTLCDYISYFLTFGGVTLGLYNRTSDPFYLQLGAVMLGGFALGMLATVYLRKRHTAEGRAHELNAVVIERLERNRSDPGAWLAGHVRHFATRATFSYFVLLFGLLDWWFLLLGLATFGAHVFWLAVLYNARFLED